MENNYTFKQAVTLAVIGLIPAILAAISANSASNEANVAKLEAEKIYKNHQIRQARLDERDLILASFNGKPGYIGIPVENDDAWRIYFKCRENDGTRKDCMLRNKTEIMESFTPKVIATPLE